MIIGLLLLALACLVAGLILTSSVWLLASLFATALAAGALWSQRARANARRRAAREVRASRGDVASAPAPTRAESSATEPVGIDRGDARAAQPELVWVIDGRPRYHRRECEVLEGKDPEVLESVVRAQAVDDGFIRCSLCEP